MKNIVKSVIAAMGFLLLAGCATIVDGTHQNVQVLTTPVKHASCVASNSKGRWHSDSESNSMMVHRAYGALAITCHKKGYVSASKTVESNIKAMAFGNIIFGGPLGAVIDVADGAAYDYPDTITLPMKKSRV